MDYTKVKPTSQQVLDQVAIQLLVNKNANLCSVVSYKGAGIKYCIRYILNNQLDSIDKDAFYIWLNLKTIDNNFFTSALSSISTVQVANLKPETQKLLIELVNQDKVTKGEFVGFLKFLEENDAKIASFILEGLEVILTGNLLARDVIIELLRESFSYKILFIEDVELDEDKKAQRGQLGSFIATHKFLGNQFMFDETAIEESAVAYEVKLNDVEKNFMIKYCFGEPSVFKKIIINLESFRAQKLFIQDTVEKIYQILGSEWATDRFTKIANNLSSQSIIELKASVLKNPSEYLKGSGLAQENPSGYQVYNPLFDYFIKALYKPPKIIKASAEFTAQEKQLYDLLKKNFGDIVSKEAIAKEIWGEGWEQTYSEWGLDKLISKTRAKLKTVGDEELVVIKKRGIKLQKL